VQIKFVGDAQLDGEVVPIPVELEVTKLPASSNGKGKEKEGVMVELSIDASSTMPGGESREETKLAIRAKCPKSEYKPSFVSLNRRSYRLLNMASSTS